MSSREGMKDEEEYDVADAFADPAACGLAAAVLLLLSVIVAVSSGQGPNDSVVWIEIEFELKQPPDNFSLTLSRAEDGCFVRNRLTSPRGNLVGNKVDLRNQAGAFRTPPGIKPAIGFSLASLSDKRFEGGWKAWKVGLIAEFHGPPRALELGCIYDGDFVPERVTVRGAIQGALGEPPLPVDYRPDGHTLHATLANGRLDVSK
jgi:hypothetical protein